MGNEILSDICEISETNNFFACTAPYVAQKKTSTGTVPVLEIRINRSYGTGSGKEIEKKDFYSKNDDCISS